MSEHAQGLMLSTKVLFFFFPAYLILMSFFSGSRDIRTYTYARWFHADN